MHFQTSRAFGRRIGTVFNWGLIWVNFLSLLINPTSQFDKSRRINFIAYISIFHSVFRFFLANKNINLINKNETFFLSVSPLSHHVADFRHGRKFQNSFSVFVQYFHSCKIIL